MLVGEHMSQPVVSVSPMTPAATAMKLIKDKHIRRLPVLDDEGRLVGIVSERDLLRAMPSPATLLSVWEIPALLERILVTDLMTRDVLTVTPETPIQVAAQLMVDHKIGGLPVELPGGKVVGVITETDIFRVFCSMFAAEAVATPA